MTGPDWSTTRWTGEAAALAAGGVRLPVLSGEAVRPAIAGLDLWDMWPIADADGRTLRRGGRGWWFFLAAAHGPDPEGRHDRARIHLTSIGDDGWRDHGPAFPAGLAPGSREWSGSAVVAGNGTAVRMFFTAAGDRLGGPHFRQRLFETQGRLVVDAGRPRCEAWSIPAESVVADPRFYAAADQPAPVGGGIKGFRDPGYFRDAADGAEYLFYTGSAAGGPAAGLDGVIGAARHEGDKWHPLPPVIDAAGVNAEMERPHVVARDGRYYLFWSTQRRRFAPDSTAPTGLYGMVADRLGGEWTPLNGHGLVAGNPEAAPYQAYCWWVTGEGEAIAFVDYPGADDPHGTDAGERRRRFGGTPTPFFTLAFAGDRVVPA